MSARGARRLIGRVANRGDVKAGSAYVALNTDDSKLRRGLDAAIARLRSFASEADAIAARVGQLGVRMALFGAAQTTAIVAVAKSFADTGDKLARLQEQTGLSAAALSGLARAAADNDVALEGVAKALTLLQKGVANGGAAVEGAFELLGSSIDEVRQLRPEQVIALIADRLRMIPDEANRTAAALALFGKNGAEMLAVFRDGAAGLNASADAARNSGDAFSQDALDGAKKLADAFDQLSASGTGLRNALGASLVPVLAPLVNTLAAVAARVSAWVDKNPELARSVLGLSIGITALGAGLVAASTAAATGITIVSVAAGALGSVLTALTAVSTAATAGLAGTAGAAAAEGVAATGAATATAALAAACGGLGVVLFPVVAAAAALAAGLVLVGVGLFAVTGLAKEATEALGVTETGFGDLFNSIRVGGRGLATWFGTFWSYLSEGFSSVWFNVVTGFDFLWTSIKGLASGFYDDVIAPIVDFFSPILDGIWNVVSTVFGWIGEKIAWMWGKLSGFVGAIKDSIVEDLDASEDDGDNRTKNFSQRLEERRKERDAAIAAERAKREELLADDPNDGKRFGFDADRAGKGLVTIGNSITSGLTKLLDRFMPAEEDPKTKPPKEKPFPEAPGVPAGGSMVKPLDAPTEPARDRDQSASEPEEPAAESERPGIEAIGTFNAEIAGLLGFGTGLEERRTRAAEQTAENTRAIRDALPRLRVQPTGVAIERALPRFADAGTEERTGTTTSLDPRTPGSTGAGGAEVAASGGGLEERWTRAVEATASNTERIVATTSDLLDAARVRAAPGDTAADVGALELAGPPAERGAVEVSVAPAPQPRVEFGSAMAEAVKVTAAALRTADAAARAASAAASAPVPERVPATAPAPVVADARNDGNAPTRAAFVAAANARPVGDQPSEPAGPSSTSPPAAGAEIDARLGQAFDRLDAIRVDGQRLARALADRAPSSDAAASARLGSLRGEYDELVNAIQADIAARAELVGGKAPRLEVARFLEDPRRPDPVVTPSVDAERPESTRANATLLGFGSTLLEGLRRALASFKAAPSERIDSQPLAAAARLDFAPIVEGASRGVAESARSFDALSRFAPGPVHREDERGDAALLRAAERTAENTTRLLERLRGSPGLVFQ